MDEQRCQSYAFSEKRGRYVCNHKALYEVEFIFQSGRKEFMCRKHAEGMTHASYSVLKHRLPGT